MKGIVLTVQECSAADYDIPCPCCKQNERLIDRMCSPIRVAASFTKVY
jgi:hypothetical protein